ncbi:MAG: uracil-DNA glycosylase [Gemmatimonadaceae bacterium]|nr:uracil-DNA glycosylase [Gemmatimonadaceae bacterium]
MDARERLRQYLEQRRELGEREFILDDLSVEDALKTLGVSARMSAAAPSPRAPERPVRAPRNQFPLPPAPVEPTPAPAAAPTEIAAPISVPSSPAPTTSWESLDAIAQAVKGCTSCPLHAAAQNAVPGEGSPTADFVCVGEGPGANEDATGRPFVGAAGELLTKILEAIKLTRDEVYIANVVKHRPPGNRTPTPEEISACTPYLTRQLQLLQPKVILALGATAAQALLGSNLALGKLRGQIHRYHGIPVVVTYHPAALLRNPNWKRPTWEDVQLARRILDNAV